MSRDIDTGRVIEEVRLRKCLWDASDQFYKNKDARLKAWSDIVVALFEDVQENEKNDLEKQIQQRWKTARDAFFRCKASTKNTPSGSAAKKMKKYVFYDELTFLSKTDVNLVTESSQVIYSNNSSSINNTEETPNTSTLEYSQNKQLKQEQEEQGSTQMPRIQRRNKQQSLQVNNNFEKELLALLSNQMPDINKDDLTFFSSLGPVLRSFDLVQKLQLRSRVLAVAMDVQNMYHRPNSSSTNDTIDNETQGGYRTQVQNMYHRPNSSLTNDIIDNETQGGYRSETTYEEYAPRIYNRPNSSSANQTMDNEAHSGYRTQTTYQEYVPSTVSGYETEK